jgi:ribosomal protein S18 acetylase RimI-like enzyme
MNDNQFPEVPDIEQAYRAAHRALEAIMPESFSFVPEADLDGTDVILQFPVLVDEAALAVAAHLGPYIGWRAEQQRGDFGLIAAALDLDNDGERSFGPILDEAATAAEQGDSSLEQAALVYRRETGRDLAPELAGIWLVMLVPGAVASEDAGWWDCAGYLAGFMILYDRDEDGTYETIGHIWTAQAWRHRGIARQLLHEARSRFGARTFEEPLTEDGSAFVEASRTHRAGA